MATQIRMVQSQAGPRMTRPVGAVLTVGEDVGKEEAARMVRAGIAVPEGASKVDMKVLEADDARVIERMEADAAARAEQRTDKRAIKLRDARQAADAKPARGRRKATDEGAADVE